jgi:predicted lipoprotein with Yx(FWY)xxD motif
MTDLVIKTASVAGLGTVLVDSQGHTLYTLTSEESGALTCTTASGCTTYGPEIDMAAGQTSQAQAPAEASLLGTERGASGGQLVTYHGLPLYTFSGDTAAGQASGEGLTSFGGTWYAISVSGILVKPAAAAPAPTATPSSSY